MASFFITPEQVEFGSRGGSATLLITNMPVFGVSYTASGDSNKFLISNFSEEGVATVSPRGVNNTSSDYIVTIKYVNNQDSSDYTDVTLVQRAGVLSVEPSTIDLDYTSGSSDSVTVNYVGTLSVAADNWLSSRMVAETETGFETWGITAITSNPSGYTRTGSVTFTDSNDNSSVAVAVTQAANPSPALPFGVTPSSLSYTGGGQTKAVTLTNIPSGGYATTNPSWISVLTSGSSISLTASNNTSTSQRTGTVEFTDNDDVTNTCAVSVAQDGKIYVSPSTYRFPYQGGTQAFTIYNFPSVGVSWRYSTEGSIPGTVSLSGNIVTISATAATSERGLTTYLYVEESDNYNQNYARLHLYQRGRIAPRGYYRTDIDGLSLDGIVELKKNGQPYATYEEYMYVPSTVAVSVSDSWVTSCRMSVSGSYDFGRLYTSAPRNSGDYRSASYTVYDSAYPANTWTSTIYQDGQLRATPASVSFNGSGETIAVNLSNTFYYYTKSSVSGQASWVSISFTDGYANSGYSPLYLTAEENTTGSVRTGYVRLYTFYDETNYVDISVTQDIVQTFSVSPTSLSFTAGGQTKTATLTNIPSGGYTTAKPSWITLSVSGSTVSLQASANHTGAQRAGTVTFTDNDDNTNSCSISVSQSYSALSVSPTSLSFVAGGETKTATLSNIPSGGVTITSPSWASATREGNTITVVASSNSTGADRTGTVTITDSAHSSNTCTISLTQSKLQIAVTPTTLNFNSGGESKTVTLTNIPSGGYTTTKPNWITLSGTGSVITLTVASYTGSSSRSAEVTFIDTNDSANRCVVTVVQEGEGILPIWRDIEYIPEDVQAGEDYLYRIVGPGDLDYEGLSVAVSLTGGQAYPGPINVARIVESHIHSSSSGLFVYPANQWNVLGQRYTAAFSHIKNGTETFIKDFVFWNDWSGYRTRYSSTQTLNEPINNRGAQNMLIPLCVFNTFDSSFSIVNDSSTESLGIPPYQFSIYTGSYTGEKVEFKMGTDTLFSYDLTYCGQGYFIYRNRYGAWDSFLIEGNITKEESYKKEQFTTTGLNTLSDSWTKRTDKTNITTTYSATTGWMTDQEAERFVYHLISSPEVYFKDFLQTAHTLTPDRMISSNLTVSKTEYKQFKNGRKLTRYTITWEESKIKQIQR